MRDNRLRIFRLSSLLIMAWLILAHPHAVSGANIGPRPTMRDPILLTAVILAGIFFFVVAVGLLAIHILRAGQGRGDFLASRGLYLLTWFVLFPALSLSLAGFTNLSPVAIPVTLMIESVVTVIYATLRKFPLESLLPITLLTNIFTVFPFWFIYWINYPDFSIPALLGAEVLVWFVEAGVIHGALRPRLSLRDALVFSFIANGLSLVIGILLPIQ
jgi:hypothetical protein